MRPPGVAIPETLTMEGCVRTQIADVSYKIKQVETALASEGRVAYLQLTNPDKLHGQLVALQREREQLRAELMVTLAPQASANLAPPVEFTSSAQQAAAAADDCGGQNPSSTGVLHGSDTKALTSGELAALFPGSVYLWAAGETRAAGDVATGWLILVTQILCYAQIIYSFRRGAGGAGGAIAASSTEGEEPFTLLELAVSMFLMVGFASPDIASARKLLSRHASPLQRSLGVGLLLSVGGLVAASVLVLGSFDEGGGELILSAAAVLFVADLDEKTYLFLSNMTVLPGYRVFLALQLIACGVTIAALTLGARWSAICAIALHVMFWALYRLVASVCTTLDGLPDRENKTCARTVHEAYRSLAGPRDTSAGGGGWDWRFGAALASFAVTLVLEALVTGQVLDFLSAYYGFLEFPGLFEVSPSLASDIYSSHVYGGVVAAGLGLLGAFWSCAGGARLSPRAKALWRALAALSPRWWLAVVAGLDAGDPYPDPGRFDDYRVVTLVWQVWAGSIWVVVVVGLAGRAAAAGTRVPEVLHQTCTGGASVRHWLPPGICVGLGRVILGVFLVVWGLIVVYWVVGLSDFVNCDPTEVIHYNVTVVAVYDEDGSLAYTTTLELTDGVSLESSSYSEDGDASLSWVYWDNVSVTLAALNFTRSCSYF